jgi:glycosyltransferase involved in cell wall biosynthesis
VCANAICLRNDRPCEECVDGAAWPALRHRCYAQSLSRTAVIVAVNALHRRLGTYTRAVDAFILLNDFNRQIFQRAGFPADKLLVKGNFVPASGLGHRPRKCQAVFVGTLNRSKGVHLLLEAWATAALTDYRLLVIGDGPDRNVLQQQFAHAPNVEWCGPLNRQQVLEHMAASRILVLPSLTYENCPMVVLEALSVATPVVAADHASLKTMVQHQREGLLFQAGDAGALSVALQDALRADDATWSRWSEAARQTHAERYSDTVSSQQLVSIYRTVMRDSSAHAPEVALAS